MNSRARWAHLKESVPTTLSRRSARAARRPALRSAALAGVVMAAMLLGAPSPRTASQEADPGVERSGASTAQATPYRGGATVQTSNGDSGSSRRLAPRASVPPAAGLHDVRIRPAHRALLVLARQSPPAAVVGTRGYQATAPPRLPS